MDLYSNLKEKCKERGVIWIKVVFGLVRGFEIVDLK